MNTDKIFNFIVDKDNLSVKVERSYNAPLDLVWSAWTEAELLDKWWGPKPYHVETKSMDFSEGGTWLYAMVSPEGAKHWAIRKFLKIAPLHYLHHLAIQPGHDLIIGCVRKLG